MSIVTDWITFLLVGSENYSSHNSLAWLLGFGGNHSLLFFVQYCHHHIETRQIQYDDWNTVEKMSPQKRGPHLYLKKSFSFETCWQQVLFCLHFSLLSLLRYFFLKNGKVWPAIFLKHLSNYLATCDTWLPKRKIYQLLVYKNINII